YAPDADTYLLPAEHAAVLADPELPTGFGLDVSAAGLGWYVLSLDRWACPDRGLADIQALSQFRPPERTGVGHSTPSSGQEAKDLHQDYYERRITEGKTRREIIRCLKRQPPGSSIWSGPHPEDPRHRGIPAPWKRPPRSPFRPRWRGCS
ncbi:hypothetical protein, partial [Streptomyces sp. Isolate_219]|uniref:hypothetical protein n=1 Tax=Streptomyces sp. Isolate_219 TaxID=2950110 RepID=UPI0021CA025A